MKDAAVFMIIVSDNIATNIMIDYLGLDTINRCIEKLGCKDTILYNPIHFDRTDNWEPAHQMITAVCLQGW